jgi:hypothetical protein
MSYWYVPGQGLRKCDEKPSDEAVEIPAATYHTCIENYSMYNLGFKDGIFFANIDVNAYRLAALDKLKNMNYIVYRGTRYFDDELPYISESYFTRDGYPCKISQEQMIALVTERNRKYGILRRRVTEAECADEIDAYMRA